MRERSGRVRSLCGGLKLCFGENDGLARVLQLDGGLPEEGSSISSELHGMGRKRVNTMYLGRRFDGNVINNISTDVANVQSKNRKFKQLSNDYHCVCLANEWRRYKTA